MRKTQRQRLYDLLSSRQWVSLPQILDLRISQYSARVYELRQMGAVIENRTEWKNGELCSWFRLVSAPVTLPNPSASPEPKPEGTLFDLGQAERSYKE